MAEEQKTTPQDPDRDLVERLKKKEEGAQKEFVTRFRDQAARAAAVFLGRRDPEAEGVVQETFELALRDVDLFEFKTTLASWLNRICVASCWRRLRARHDALDAAEKGLAQDLGLSPDLGPLRQAIQPAQREALRMKLGKLKEPCRTLVSMRELEGLTPGGIARVVKEPVGAVLSRLALCVETLNSALKDQAGGSHG